MSSLPQSKDDQNARLSRGYGYSTARDQACPRRSVWIVVSTHRIKMRGCLVAEVENFEVSHQMF
jgi:hypothetical protein